MKKITYKDLVTTLEVLRAIAKDKQIQFILISYLLYEVDKKIKDISENIGKPEKPMKVNLGMYKHK